MITAALAIRLEIKKAPIEVSMMLPGPVKTRIFTDSEGGLDQVSRYHRQVMEAMLDGNGISSEGTAAIILPQIARGDFWASTHPEMTRDYALQRARTFTHLETPALTSELSALLQEE